MVSIADKWDQIYRQKTGEPAVAEILNQHQHYLPTCGVALDLACGRGGNALLLARAGLQTMAWDISEVGITQCQQAADKENLPLIASVWDVESMPPEPNSVDVIVVSQFLHRPLCAALVEALRPRGLLFYQTHSVHKAAGTGPNNPDYVLQDNELLSLFSALQVRAYHEPIRLAEGSITFQGQAALLAQKR
jgi:SAM-dependent methyltransferase